MLREENMIPIGDLKQFSEPNPAFRVLKPWWDVLAEYTNIIMAMLSLFTASLQISEIVKRLSAVNELKCQPKEDLNL
ncbi:volume-regulated anion channel subunit LRRC8E-like [Pleurodeles waltl]|uniref:volume-regulated anion channel subunit LRRC8E-like n=1 Tax=Pleurodeles waltl TaxID=8319 RepID=UPI0037095800